MNKHTKLIFFCIAVLLTALCCFWSAPQHANAETSWWERRSGEYEPNSKQVVQNSPVEANMPEESYLPVSDSSSTEALAAKNNNSVELQSNSKQNTLKASESKPQQNAVEAKKVNHTRDMQATNVKKQKTKPKKRKSKKSKHKEFEPQNYIRADVIVSIPSEKIAGFHLKKPDHDIGGGFGLGRIFTDRIRADVTASFSRYLYRAGPGSQDGKEHNKLTSLVFMANGYYHLTKGKSITVHVTDITPYVMGGIGFAINKVDDWTDEVPFNFRHLGASSQNFAWQVGIGALFKIKNNINADLMYRYADLGKTKTKNLQSINNGLTWTRTSDQSQCARMHEISIGIFFKL